MADGAVVTRLEYWDAGKEEWYIGHAGVPLLHPEKYPERLAKNGRVGRATVLETGETFTAAALVVCPMCDEPHPLPHDGGCIL